jgi:hypothetical protein
MRCPRRCAAVPIRGFERSGVASLTVYGHLLEGKDIRSNAFWDICGGGAAAPIHLAAVRRLTHS